VDYEFDARLEHTQMAVFECRSEVFCFFPGDSITVIDNTADRFYYELEGEEGIRNSCGQLEHKICKWDEPVGTYVMAHFDNGYSNTYQWKDLRYCEGPTFPTPKPARDRSANRTAIREARRAVRKGANMAARVPQMAENEKRRREAADGCASFCAVQPENKKCTYKMCQKCSDCAEEQAAKKFERHAQFRFCLPYCKKNNGIGTWKFKCLWDSCHGCSECHDYTHETVGKPALNGPGRLPRRLAAEEEKKKDGFLLI
jgi:hypothetical protein